MLYEELVAISTATTRVGCERGVPVFSETWATVSRTKARTRPTTRTLDKDLLYALWPDFGATAIFQQLPMLSLGGQGFAWASFWPFEGNSGRRDHCGGCGGGEERDGMECREDAEIYIQEVGSFRAALVIKLGTRGGSLVSPTEGV